MEKWEFDFVYNLAVGYPNNKKLSFLRTTVFTLINMLNVFFPLLRVTIVKESKAESPLYLQ